MSELTAPTLESPEVMTTEEVVAVTRKLNYGTWRYQKTWKPMHVVDAEGCYFIDAAGKRYLDFSSQLMCVNLGHKNKAVIQAIQDQAAALPYIMPGYATTARAELSKLLLEVLPAGLEKFFFTTSGTEANEAAFKIARMYTGKTKIIARYRSYHGSTMASIAATGDPRRWAMEPGGKGQGFLFAPEVNCYKCPIKHTYPSCNIACADYLEHMIENEHDVAAVIVEPIVGTNGVLIPPKEYFPKLREICDRHGVLLIADEVMAGWGRTGEWFSVDHWGTKPDMLVTAKGITSAYVPLGLCATTAKIGDYFEDHFFSHGHTYEAHPLTLGARHRCHPRNAATGSGQALARDGDVPRRKAACAEGKASIDRRRSRSGTLLGGRARPEPCNQDPTEQHAGQGRWQANGHRKGRRRDDEARRHSAGLDQPLCHRSSADYREERD